MIALSPRSEKVTTTMYSALTTRGLRALRTLASVALVATASACGHGFEAKTPSGFVELEEDSMHAYRAVTADGLVIAVREIEHDPKGEMSFWKSAIENELRRRGGYALLGERDVKTSSGLSGKELRFGHDEGQKPHEYVITLFVTDDWLYLLEAGGTEEQMKKNKAQLDEYVASFRVD